MEYYQLPLLKKPFADPTLTLTSSALPEGLKPEDRGLLLIQLLLACTTHASAGNLHHADGCLRHIAQLSSVSGDSMQRLAAHFALSLAGRLLKRWPGLHRALNQVHHHQHRLGQKLTAQLAFSRTLPYLRFAYTAVQSALLDAASDEKVVYIIDIGSGDPNLWAPLLRAFSWSPSGPPHPKITCLREGNKDVLSHMGSELVKVAEALDIPFQFNPLNVGLRDANVDMFKVRSGEALAICSMLSLHNLLAEDDILVDSCMGAERAQNLVRPCKQLDSFLSMVWTMSPKVFMLAEQDVDHNSPRLMDRLIEGLYYYSATFDSVEASASSMSYLERLAVEEMLGAEIESVVGCEGSEREARHEPSVKWAVRMGRAGFWPVTLWGETKDEARRLVESSGRDDYNVVNERGFLTICWHERPIYAVSAWQC